MNGKVTGESGSATPHSGATNELQPVLVIPRSSESVQQKDSGGLEPLQGFNWASASLDDIFNGLKERKISVTEVDAQREYTFPKLLGLSDKTFKALVKKHKLDEPIRVEIEGLRKKALKVKADKAFKELLEGHLKEWSDAGFRLPPGYVIEFDTVNKCCEKNDSSYKVLNTIMWVDCLVHDLSTDMTKFLVKWIRNGKTHSMRIDRNLIVQARKLAETLCSEGTLFLPDSVTEGAAFLAEFENLNVDIIEDMSRAFRIATKPGWVNVEDTKVFAAYDPKIQFEPETEISMSQFLKTKGSFAEWLKVRPFVEKSKAQAVLLAAAVAPMLLEPLGKPGFVVDQYGKSSTGKTTALCLAASMYGAPGGNTGDGLVVTWDSTKTYTERVLQYFSHMPIFCMDSHSTREEALQAIAYMVGNGSGRGRATKNGGTQERATFRSVLLSDGESAMYDKLVLDGAKARVISIQGAVSQGLTSEDVVELTSIFRSNYGHVAQRVIEHLNIEKLQQACVRYEQQFAEQVSTAMSQRLAKHFAVIATAAEAISAIPEMTWFQEVFDKQLVEVFAQSMHDLEEESQSTKAMKMIAEWVTENEAHFAFDSISNTQLGCYGRIDRKNNLVSIIGNPLREFMKRVFGTHGEAVMKNLRYDKLVDNQRKIRIAGKTISTFSFEYSKLFGSESEDDVGITPDDEFPAEANFRLERAQQLGVSDEIVLHGMYARRLIQGNGTKTATFMHRSCHVHMEKSLEAIDDKRFSPGAFLKLEFTGHTDDSVAKFTLVE